MAQFIFGNSFKEQLARRPLLRNALWRSEALVLGTLMRILSWLPADRVSRFGQRLGQALGPRLPKHKAIRTNLRLAFPGRSEDSIDDLARGIWGNAGRVLTEFACLQEICNERRIRIDVDVPIPAFEQQDRPLIIVTAHLSNWEILAYAITRMIQPVAAPYTAPSNPWLASKLQHYRAPLGVQLFERDSSMRPLVKRIRSGDTLVFLADQRVDSGKPVPFMGMDKLTTLVPARLALRFQCDLVPVRVQRLQDARYHVRFYPPVDPGNRQLDENARALHMMTEVNALFESWIREQPEEWFCSNRLWSKQLERQLPGTAGT